MNIDRVVDLIMENLGEMLETPAGPGTGCGLVDREGAVMMLLDQGERMAGGIVVLRAIDIQETSGLNMIAAVEEARRVI